MSSSTRLLPRLSMMFVRFLFGIALCITACSVEAQMYLGVTGDFGNKVAFNPQPSDEIITSPAAPSFSFTLLKQERIRNDWCLQYGFATGILGYIVKTKDGVDTVSTVSGPVSYTIDWNYFTPYASVHLTLGKSVLIGKKKITFFLGGGATLYANSASSTRGSVVVPGGSADLYYYSLESKQKNFKGFVETSIQTISNVGQLLVCNINITSTPR